jgi:cell division protein FtsX
MPYASGAVVFVFSLLFLTCLTGVSMLSFLTQEKTRIETTFTYPLALNPLYTFESQRVKDFAESLVSAGLRQPIEYITREQALDREIQRNPGILTVLAGENPLPDVVVIPLQGVNTDIFWQRIREFRDLFEWGAEIQDLRMRLKKFNESLDEIRDIWVALLLFTGLTLVLMLMLLVAILRYHLRLFTGERVVGRLVGADPIFIWWPHAVTGTVYLVMSMAIAFGLFQLLQHFF